MRDYNAARASQFFLGMMSGRFMLMDHRVVMERAQFAAAMGNPEAQMFLRGVGASSRRSGTPISFLNAWRCPACGGKGATASGRDETVRCERGHLRNANPDDKRDPFLRKLLSRR